MRRLASATFALGLAAALVLAALISVEDSEADLDNQVFTSRADRIRMVVPRLWRATDQASYPGMLLWMIRHQPPPGQIVLTAETLTRELYCSWPVACRAGRDPLPLKYACAIRARLEAQRLRVGPVQAGPKENEAAGVPSVWFEYDDRKRFLRQAVALTPDRAISLVLSAGSSDARATHVRAFDQALRTLRLLTVAETAPTDAGVAPAPSDAGAASPPSDAAAASPPSDAGAPPPPPGDAGAAAPAGTSPSDAGAEPAPAPAQSPVGPCPS